MQSKRRNLKWSVEGVLQSADISSLPTTIEDKSRHRRLTTSIVYLAQNIACLHALPIADHCSATKPFSIRPLRLSEPRNSMIDVVRVKNPISTRCAADTLAFDNE